MLLQTVRLLAAIQPPACEILVVDQTEMHEPCTDLQLNIWHEHRVIRWIRLEKPSIPAAMNVGLLEASSEVVLFVDDDVEPNSSLVVAHFECQRRAPGIVAGQVMQPGEVATVLGCGEPFRFNSTEPLEVSEFIGCNFSVNRDMALAIGGFDENFEGAAYRYEAEFAHRFAARFRSVLFEPKASLHHLHVSSGGTRAKGSHLQTIKPAHSVGAYYYWLRTRRPGWLWGMMLRPFRSVRTRHHLKYPWWIPLTLLAEVRGIVRALALFLQAPKLIAIDRIRDGIETNSTSRQ